MPNEPKCRICWSVERHPVHNPQRKARWHMFERAEVPLDVDVPDLETRLAALEARVRRLEAEKSR